MLEKFLLGFEALKYVLVENGKCTDCM